MKGGFAGKFKGKKGGAKKGKGFVKGKGKGKGLCNICGSPDHWMDQCPQKGGFKKGGFRKGSGLVLGKGAQNYYTDGTPFTGGSSGSDGMQSLATPQILMTDGTGRWRSC